MTMNAMLAGLLVWLGVAAVCLCDPTSAGWEQVCTTEDYYQQPRGICGPKLSSILAIVCQEHGGYNKRAHEHSSMASAYFPMTRDLTYGGSKMAGAGASDDTGDLHVPSEQSSRLARQNVFLPKASALAFLHDKRSAYVSDGSSSRGIVCECCVHQCTISEFRDYCAEPPK